jgi:hypothetical protein
VLIDANRAAWQQVIIAADADASSRHSAKHSNHFV